MIAACSLNSAGSVPSIQGGTDIGKEPNHHVQVNDCSKPKLKLQAFIVTL